MLLGAILGVVIIAIASAGVFLRYQQTVASGQEIRQTLQPAGEHANALAADVSQLDRSLQVYALGARPVALESFNTLLARAVSELDAIEAMPSTDLDQARTDSNRVETNLTAWRTQAADPVIEAVKAGNNAQARQLLIAPKSLALFTAVEASSRELSTNLNQQRRAAIDETSHFIDLLGKALIIAAALAVLSLIGLIYLAIRWFLNPLNQLRRQLRHVARRGHHDDPIIPNGPPEIAAAGSDAELMRRELVSNHDEARAATEGLAQEGPVVTGIRELLAPANPELNLSNLEIAGSTHAAEGVMSGDWWDSFTLSDGRIVTVLTDISGHGSNAAVTALNSKITVSDAIKDTSDLTLIAANLSECFGETSFEAQQADDHDTKFATSALLAFNPENYELEWINAGHPAPVIIDSNGVVRKLDPTGPIMSTLGGNWSSNKATLKPGQTVIAWSDGLSESRDRQGKFLDDEGVTDLVEQLNQQRATSARKLVPLVLSRIRQRATDWDHDDTTLVIIQIH